MDCMKKFNMQQYFGTTIASKLRIVLLLSCAFQELFISYLLGRYVRIAEETLELYPEGWKYVALNISMIIITYIIYGVILYSLWKTKRRILNGMTVVNIIYFLIRSSILMYDFLNNTVNYLTIVQLLTELFVIVMLVPYLTVFWEDPGSETPTIELQEETSPLKSSEHEDSKISIDSKMAQISVN